MTQRSPLSGDSWTLIATGPTRVLLQAQGGDIQIHISASVPSTAETGFLVRQGDWADFIGLDDFGVLNMYARASGKSATAYFITNV